MAWYQLDYEDMLIRCYSNSNTCMLKLSDNNIVVGKPSESTTEITQTCDVGDGFV
jgi:hypothetical protein